LVQQVRAWPTHVPFATMATRQTAFAEGGIQCALLHDARADAGRVRAAPRAKPRIVPTLDGEDTLEQAFFAEKFDTGFAIDGVIKIATVVALAEV
jgi:hypothetical protein